MTYEERKAHLESLVYNESERLSFMMGNLDKFSDGDIAEQDRVYGEALDRLSYFLATGIDLVVAEVSE